jgi:hypothetical protein
MNIFKQWLLYRQVEKRAVSINAFAYAIHKQALRSWTIGDEALFYSQREKLKTLVARHRRLTRWLGRH